jgi:hypothetical protein
MQLYKDSVADAGNGFAAMSMTKAKKDILNMSNEEIRLDLEQQRLEKAAAAELANTANIIKKTGLFDKIDNIYGDTEGGAVTEGTPESTAPPVEGGELPPTEEPMGELPPTTESKLNDIDKLLVESKEFLTKEYEVKKKKYTNNYMNKLMESLDNKENVKVLINENKENVSDLNTRYNNDITNMMDDIDNLIKK